MDTVGNVVMIKNIELPPRTSSSFRGGILGFSNKLRRNLLRFLQSIGWNTIPVERIYEVTLTYHSMPESGEVVKEHLRKIRKNILDKYRRTILIWKLEFQRRGAPHCHLIMITQHAIELGDYQYVNKDFISFYDRKTKKHLETGIPGFRAYLQFRWNTILEEDDMHFNSGIEVEKVRNPKGFPQYLAKYNSQGTQS
ncbi:MAG: rolling circle replication-associated protein [Eubacteriales bacterium]